MGPLNFKMLNGLTAATDRTSAALTVDRTYNASFQVTTTGTATGTLKVQVSNDAVLAPNVPANWTDLSGATVTVAAAGSLLIPKIDLAYECVRVVWTHDNGGTGTITVTIKGNDY